MTRTARPARLARRVGRYEILERIAVGGMAEVYRARYRGIGGISRLVVVKRIRSRYAEDGEFLTMFLDEARLMAALSHPHIAQVYEVGHVDDTWFIAMEYIHGLSLHDLLNTLLPGEQLPEAEVVCIALKVAEALDYVHGCRDETGQPLSIVHRDINPSNVLLSVDGAIKLIDFGIAKAVCTVHETRMGVVKGTGGYVAPEMAAGKADHRADVFATGVMIYELLLERRPFQAQNPGQALRQAALRDYPAPLRLRPELDPGLARLIDACLEPDPEDRLPSMRALVEWLETWLGRRSIVPTHRRLARLMGERISGAGELPSTTCPDDSMTAESAAPNFKVYA